MCTLVFSGDIWHPTYVVRAGLEMLEGLEFDWIEHADQWPAERVFEYPLIVLAKANQISESDKSPWVTPEIEQVFLDYVRQGNGLLVVHGGLAGYRQLPGLRAMMGGTFIQHPKQCPVTVEPKTGHRLTDGSVPFTLTDEHYFVALEDEKADVYLTTDLNTGLNPAAGLDLRVKVAFVC